MAPRRPRAGFFSTSTRPEDEAARQEDVAALLPQRRPVVQDIPIDRIAPNPFQARRSFDDLDELAEAIRVQGFTSRLRVRPHPESAHQFQIVYGERRLRAAHLAGLLAVPCDIADHSDTEMIEIGLAENIQRRDLTPLEEARAFRTLIDERTYSVRRLAERIGKDKSYVENRLTLLRVPDDVQHMVEQRPDSLRAAREIARLDDAGARAPLIAGVIAGELTTEAVREAVREARTLPLIQADEAPVDTRPAPAPLDPLRTRRRQIQKDITTLRVIVQRWAQWLDAGDGERALLAPALADIRAELDGLADYLRMQIEDERDGDRQS